MRLRTFALGLVLLLASCTSPAAGPAQDAPGQPPEPQSAIPDHCRGDGAVQTWQLLPVEPAASDLLAAYDAREVVEFSGAILGSDDDPSRLPHRRTILREAAEGITLTLDYQGDPPPLALGPRYRFVAWADFVPQAPEPAPTDAAAAQAQALPQANSYELQIYDRSGLLFLGLTDTDLADDPLGIEIGDDDGDCPVVTITNNPCVETRQVLPLRITWGDDAITLLPGEDGQLAHDGARYAVSVFRNRRVQFAAPACPGYREYQRSLRIERLDPAPALPAPPPPPTTTTPLTSSAPITASVLETSTSP